MEMRNPSQLPSDTEQSRILALKHYKILDTPPEKGFDDLAQLACNIFNLPVCLITFIDEDTVFFKANIGFGNETSEPRQGSICAQTLMADKVMVMEDISQIPHFADNTQQIRFYAGAPIISAKGHRLGTICVMDYKAVVFNERHQEVLSGLAKIVLDHLDLRLIGLEDEVLRKNNNELRNENEKIIARNHNLVEYQEQVTEANNHLEHLQDSFSMLFHLAPIGIGVLSTPDRVIRQANSALIKILECNEDIIAQTIENLIPDVEGQKFLNLINEVQKSGKSAQASEIKLRVVKGSQLSDIYVNVSIQSVGRLGDHDHNIMFLVTDVTELVQAKQLTEEANVVLKSALEAGSVGYTVVEFATGRMESNAQLKSNYGFEADEPFDYTDLFEAMLPKYRMQIKQAVQKAIETNGIYSAEYEVKWRDGSIHWIRAYGKPKYDSYGRASHIIGLNKIIEQPDK